MCKYCELFDNFASDESTPYVICGAMLGTHPNRRLSQHENSGPHKDSVYRYTQSKQNVNVFKLIVDKAENVNQENISRNRRYIQKLFKTCVFVAKKNWAQMNISDLFTFMGETCDTEINAIIKNESVTYLSSTSISEIITILSDYIERKVLVEQRGEKFTLLADESTDRSNRTQLSVFARYVKNADPVEQYLGLINVSQTTSLALMEAIEMVCRGKGIEMSNIRFVGLDGCNTMSGQRKGLQRRIRNISPLSLYVNCRNHRLALCFVHLMKNDNLLVEADALLIAIWKMLHFSPKKAAVFKNMQEVYGQRPIKFIKAPTTTWLSHLHACMRFISRFETLLDTLDAITESTHEHDVQGIRNSMTQKDNISTIVVLADILKPVNYLSLYLQEDCGTYTQLPVRVKSCTNELHSILQQYEQGDYDDLEYSKCQMMFDLIDERTDLARRMRTHHEVSPEDYQQQHGIPMVYRLIGEIEDSLGTTEPVLAAFDFLEPNNIPDDIADIPAYGKDNVRILANFYGCEKVDEFEGHRTVVPPELGNADIVHDQLLDFRRQMFLYKHQGHDTVQKMNMLLLNDPTASRAFPVMPHLFRLAMLIPQSTAVVERGFSLMNDIATDLKGVCHRIHWTQLCASATTVVNSTMTT